jgi:lathosterol oxidase
MITTPYVVVLLVIAALGHAMAFYWYIAFKNQWKICERTIYALPISDKQIKREMKNSLHAPMHAVILAAFLYLGFFQDTSWTSFFLSGIGTTVWAEIWHYGSHRAFHLRAFHWIHAEHHKSHLNTPFTAISFSFTEKLVFDVGLLGLLAAVDHFVSLNFFGIAAWFIGYLIINSFSHANFELKSRDYTRYLGKVLTSTTYHSLHHSRYTGNYGLGTRILDRLFKTEWEDYEPLYERISREQRPLSQLRERVEEPVTRKLAKQLRRSH